MVGNPGSDVKSNAWDIGLRIVVKDTPFIRKVIRESMERVLRITDEEYMNEMEAPFMKLFTERLQKLLDNCKSWYRSKVTELSEWPQLPTFC